MENEDPSLPQFAHPRSRDAGPSRFDAAEIERAAGDAAEERSRAGIALELDETIALQRISTRLIRENDLDSLYREIVLAALAIMHSDFGSMQMYKADRDALYLLVSENFPPESARFWEWVAAGETTSCGKALESGARIIISDVESCAFIAGTEDLEHYRKSAMKAMQSTPLISRDGRPIGMLSTHWKTPHEPSELDLRLLDVLARQAADLIERMEAEEQRKLLVNELNHRVKNTIAVVQAIAQQTFRGDDVPQGVREVFEKRLEALRDAHDLLTSNHWEAADLGDMVKGALNGCGALERTTVDGPPLRFPPKVAVTLAMALHELCTNASKYGALSKADGRVFVRWGVSETSDRRFHFEWRECDGPPVIPPTRQGFGTRLIEQILASELRGEAQLDYEADGLRFTLDAAIPSESLETGTGD